MNGVSGQFHLHFSEYRWDRAFLIFRNNLYSFSYELFRSFPYFSIGLLLFLLYFQDLLILFLKRRLSLGGTQRLESVKSDRPRDASGSNITMATQEESQVQFKLVLVGDGGTGKTTFVKCYLVNLRSISVPWGSRSIPLCSTPTEDLIKFNVWDAAGQEKFDRLRDGYHLQA